MANLEPELLQTYSFGPSRPDQYFGPDPSPEDFITTIFALPEMQNHYNEQYEDWKNNQAENMDAESTEENTMFHVNFEMEHFELGNISVKADLPEGIVVEDMLSKLLSDVPKRPDEGIVPINLPGPVRKQADGLKEDQIGKKIKKIKKKKLSKGTIKLGF